LEKGGEIKNMIAYGIRKVREGGWGLGGGGGVTWGN